MDINTLAKSYINKIVEYDHNHFHDRGLSDFCCRRAMLFFKNIISENNDYLLTDSFLDYIVYYGEYDLKESLEKLCGNTNDKIVCLTKYFEKVFDEYFYRLEGHYYSYAQMIDNDLATSIKHISKILKECREYLIEGFYGYDDLYKIIYIVFSYYVLNKRQDNIYELCNVFLNDPQRVLDTLYINDVFGDEDELSTWESRDRLISYVTHKLDNRNVKEIK